MKPGDLVRVVERNTRHGGKIAVVIYRSWKMASNFHHN
jgi:hypothetical protein